MLSTLYRFAFEFLFPTTMASTSNLDFFYSNRNLSTLYSFQPHKIFKVEPIGNEVRDINCPTPRSGHRIIVAGGNIFSFGGYTPITIGEIVEHVLFKELWVYNFASRTWRHLKTSGHAPDELASHCAAYVGNDLLIFGGTAYPFGEKSSNDAHICNLKTLQWTKLEISGSAPTKQYGQAMTVHRNKVYVVGGTTGNTYSNTVHCFDLFTKEWTYLESSSNVNNSYEPDARYRHEIAIEDNKIYVFGGGTATDSFDLKELPIFNLETRLWDKVTTTGVCPAPRRCHSCVQLGSDVYVFGGLDGINSFSDIYKIDLKTLVWQELDASLPIPLYFHASALSDNYQLFIFGGVNGEENQRSNDLYSMWLKIPSLATISWQAVLHYIPHIAQIEKKKLFEIGVPIRFLNEVEFYPAGLPRSSYNSNFLGNSSSFI